MLRTLRVLLVLGTLVVSVPLPAADDDKDKLVDNPIYAAWAKHKPGATAKVVEKTTYLGGDDKDPVPDHKVITYKLLSVSDDKVVVQAVVVEQELLGTVESAPTRHHYPAKLKKSYVDVALPDLNAKKGEETIKWKGKPIKCHTLSGSYKKDGSTVEFKACFNDDIPGGIVRRTRTVKQNGTTITTTVTLQSYKPGK
jgi:hypothetical protein